MKRHMSRTLIATGNLLDYVTDDNSARFLSFPLTLFFAFFFTTKNDVTNQFHCHNTMFAFLWLNTCGESSLSLTDPTFPI